MDYVPEFLGSEEAERLLQSLTDQVAWQQHRVRLFGKWVDCPRLSAWYGDTGATYAYSGQAYSPTPWTPDLIRLRRTVEAATGERFNSVLLNRYRNGQDSMGWHADDEPELGARPTIASVSLGARRKMRFRRRDDHRVTREYWLDHGSLLVMRGDTQRDWHHALPKTKRVDQVRLNLTFRRIR